MELCIAQRWRAQPQKAERPYRVETINRFFPREVNVEAIECDFDLINYKAAIRSGVDGNRTYGWEAKVLARTWPVDEWSIFSPRFALKF